MPRKYKILLRQGTGASVVPTAANFDIGEPAWNSTDGKLYIKNAAGAMVEVGNIPDGSIATAKLADRSVTNAKIGSGRQLVGQFTTNGTQNSFTITAPAHLSGVLRWGFDWTLDGIYTNNNNSMIYVRMNNRSANNDYYSTGIFAQGSSASSFAFDWSAIHSNSLIVLSEPGPGKSLSTGTGGFFDCYSRVWTCLSNRHISGVVIDDLIYQTGYLSYGNEGLQSITFQSYSRDLNAVASFPSGFSVVVWAEIYS